MSRRRKSGLSFKQFHWLFYIALITIVAICLVIRGFFANCVFTWPTRFYSISCLKEQVEPAQRKALENTADFMPEFKI
jgi:hypothetical protein